MATESKPGDKVETKRARSAFSPRAIILGLLGAVFIAGIANFSDYRVEPGALFVGSHLPVGALTMALMLALGWNGLLGRRFPSLMLSGGEMTVILAMWLVACFPPTSGLFRYLHRQLILPWYYLNSGGKTEWETLRILDYLPGRIFPQPVPQIGPTGAIVPATVDDHVYRSFFTGLAQGRQNIGLGDIPWRGWIQPLMYWGPLIVLMSVCGMAMTLLVHRQWADHEQLSYPVAQVASMFVSRKQGLGIPDVFRSRLFWWGFVPIMLIYLIAFLNRWFPTEVPGLDVVLPNVKNWHVNLADKFPILKKAPSWQTLTQQSIFFSVVGLAYFVSSEIGLTMGLNNMLLCGVGLWFLGSTGTPLTGDDVSVFRSGAYMGFAAILLFTGRHYYGAVLKRALMPRRCRDERYAEGVFAARLTIASFAGFVALLVGMGLDWFVALMFALMLMLLFLVFTRIICETGIPFMQAGWMPHTLLVALFGPAALGPGPLIYAAYLGTILCQDPRECLMPYVATGMKMADASRLRLRVLFVALCAALAVALVAGFVAKAWGDYNYGAFSSDMWASKYTPVICFDESAKHISELADLGMLDRSRAASGLGKLALISPDPTALYFVLAGVGCVVMLSLVRFRVSKFPIHPVLFLVWGTYPASLCWASFMLGWFVKELVVKFGGGTVYQKLKPVFVGIITAELFAVSVAVIVGIAYYLATGDPPDAHFFVLPG